MNNVILDPALQPLFALLKGLRNGVVYGAKVRAPHAFVMTFLFRDGT
jgi:peroxisomal membrane protein 4